MKKITPFQYAIFLYETQKVKSFLNLLKKNNDFAKINEIIKEFEKYDKKQRGIKDCEVISTAPLSKYFKEQLLSAIGNKVEIKEIINPDILGGIIVTVGDTMIDGSLRNKLKELGRVLTYG